MNSLDNIPKDIFIRVNNTERGVPPIFVMRSIPSAIQWVRQALVEIEDELASKRMIYRAPEDRLRCYYEALKLLLTSLRECKPVSIWEINRILCRENAHFDNGAFKQACEQLFDT